MSIFRIGGKKETFNRSKAMCKDAVVAELEKKWGLSHEIAQKAADIMRGTHDTALDVISPNADGWMKKAQENVANDNTSPMEIAA